MPSVQSSIQSHPLSAETSSPMPDMTKPNLIPLQYQARSAAIDRKSTRLNSSHLGISYAVCCLKKIIDLVVHGGKEVVICRKQRVKVCHHSTLLADRSRPVEGQVHDATYLCTPVFFFNGPAPTKTYTLSLHDALPI